MQPGLEGSVPFPLFLALTCSLTFSTLPSMLRAFAGEAGVAFVSFSASEFIEMYIGWVQPELRQDAYHPAPS